MEEKDPGFKKSLIRKEKELVSTEKSYIESLRILIEKFMNPMKTLDFGLTQAQISNMFLNIEVIYQFHTRFITELENEKKQVGDIFVKFVDFLRVYVQSLNGFEASVTVINSLNSNKKFINFCLR